MSKKYPKSHVRQDGPSRDAQSREHNRSRPTSQSTNEPSNHQATSSQEHRSSRPETSDANYNSQPPFRPPHRLYSTHEQQQPSHPVPRPWETINPEIYAVINNPALNLAPLAPAPAPPPHSSTHHHTSQSSSSTPALHQHTTQHTNAYPQPPPPYQPPTPPHQHLSPSTLQAHNQHLPPTTTTARYLHEAQRAGPWNTVYDERST
ncbi:hypothetical protein P153DRAFT_355178 [Dothidotthia symphoricarpi CBS 119687]|uniref:Uncharacterized protein n=1 Tax=Dothidotthia symphoricarpi CBS 119687 TaxID=1392245 RepID=A0A6A6AHF4_9PLEO|nr:uncharacterized protein P153DRAFT_355178 [Dothidotthia symphoricarpi CBS 119687]KAF2131379.1 hypothetical protein P153DRAFT_355178 [Dothidotthia symphoricarpi CBS 119687]